MTNLLRRLSSLSSVLPLPAAPRPKHLWEENHWYCKIMSVQAPLGGEQALETQELCQGLSESWESSNNKIKSVQVPSSTDLLSAVEEEDPTQVYLVTHRLRVSEPTLVFKKISYVPISYHSTVNFAIIQHSKMEPNCDNSIPRSNQSGYPHSWKGH